VPIFKKKKSMVVKERRLTADQGRYHAKEAKEVNLESIG